ncbi:MAG: UDP-3-O-(3-hydroxymyristoyl)glucosamine N-acyltransferase [Phycisphaerae bacterium]|nr:UDP-3-O-(3-hydroxymyristoyl)glucosamine N-acyltransferase [Phycisphaerae bacterium]
MREKTAIDAAEIAKRVAGELVGEGSVRVDGIATPEVAGPTSLCWVGGPEYLDGAIASSAGVLLLPGTIPAPQGRTVIRVKDPDLALCEVLRLLAPRVERVPVGVHSTAVVAADAEVAGAAIGPRVFIGPGAHVGPGTQLHAGVHIGAESIVGRNAVLWPNVVVRERVTIGDCVIIHPNVTIGADGFGYLFRDGRHVKIPHIGTVIIEDDVEIGANSTIDRAKSGVTRIGAGTKIDNLVQIGHNVTVGRNCIIIAQCGLGGSVVLEDGVVMSGQVGVVDHVRIGAGAQIGAKSTVWGDVPPGAIYSGTPARPNQRYLRAQASMGKVPELLKELRDLRRRVEELEGRIGLGR